MAVSTDKKFEAAVRADKEVSVERAGKFEAAVKAGREDRIRVAAARSKIQEAEISRILQLAMKLKTEAQGEMQKRHERIKHELSKLGDSSSGKFTGDAASKRELDKVIRIMDKLHEGAYSLVDA